MGQRGRELAKQKFDIRQITEEYIDIYRSLGLDIS
jgi:hypothetical protein